MHVLMIAPQPFFEPRGAPLCVHQHIKALVTLGHEVDLITYPFGKNVALPGLRIYRAPGIPFMKGVKPGFSLAKFPLDLLVSLTAFWRLCLVRYRYIYTHEEAALMGIVFASLFGCKHLYYMHCDLSQLVPAYVRRFAYILQASMVRRANTIIAFYPEATSNARKIAPGRRIHTLLPAFVDSDLASIPEEGVERLRRLLNIRTGPVLLYTGTLERYQGLAMLLQSIPQVRISFPEVRYIIVGGKDIQVKRLKGIAQKLNIMDNVCFVGQRPQEEMPYYLALANIVLSPRCEGTHVPLKIYTYLHAGKAILATDILSHTQILTPELALLVPPTPQGLAQGALTLLQDPEKALALGKHSQDFAREHYNWPMFLAKSRQIHEEFMSLAE